MRGNSRMAALHDTRAVFAHLFLPVASSVHRSTNLASWPLNRAQYRLQYTVKPMCSVCAPTGTGAECPAILCEIASCGADSTCKVRLSRSLQLLCFALSARCSCSDVPTASRTLKLSSGVAGAPAAWSVPFCSSCCGSDSNWRHGLSLVLQSCNVSTHCI